MKKRQNYSNNIKSSNDDGINNQSSFSIRKAIATAVSFGMIKEVKTLDTISMITNDTQILTVEQKIFGWFSFRNNNLFNQKLFFLVGILLDYDNLHCILFSFGYLLLFAEIKDYSFYSFVSQNLFI
jgi:hypothetical protein